MISRPKLFKKILIANRGEIAIRVMRACREMCIATAAVYSDADRSAIHVRYADEAHHIGGASPTESYLQMERIVKTAHDRRLERDRGGERARLSHHGQAFRRRRGHRHEGGRVRG